MKKRVSVAAVLLAAALLFCACSQDVSYIAEYEGGRIPVSDYSLKMFTAIASAGDKTGEEGGGIDVVLEHEIDGVPAGQWINDEAFRLLKEQLATDAEFERLGLTLSDRDTAEADAAADKQWERYSGIYAKNGVSRESLISASRSTYKARYIFAALYGEGGERELPLETVADYFDKDYILFRVIGVAKRDKEGEYFEDDELEEQLAKAEGYAARLKAGENGDALVAEAEEELAELLERDLDHSHEPLESHISVAKPGELYYSVEVMEMIEGMRPGEVEIFEDDDDYYFVVQKLSAIDDDGMLLDNRLAVAYDLCLDEFTYYMDQLADTVELTVNEAALKLCDPRLFTIE